MPPTRAPRAAWAAHTYKAVQLPGQEPGYRSDLPKIEKERRPVGFRPGLQLEERLLGLGAVFLGLVGLLVVYGVWTGFLPSGLAPPPGVPQGVPVINATACLLPLIGIGSVGLILVGVKRVIYP